VGHVADVVDYGSIVTVYVMVADAHGQVEPIHFDHRMFQHFAEAEGYALIGRGIERDVVDGVETVSLLG
jgi:hypothetical protein